jgi:HD domain
MKDWIAVLRAADMAARWHVHQRRKGIAQEPYINHLLEVASLVIEATGGTDPNLVIAALLHDAVEDQGVSSEMLTSEFGQLVADIVLELTDDKALPKDERKRKQVENAPKKSNGAKLVKLADKTSNLRAIASSPAADWSVERRLAYIEWAKNVVAGLRGTPQKPPIPVLGRPPDCIEFVITHHRACYASFAHRAGNSENLPLLWAAIYEITNKDHLPLWVPENSFNLGVVESVQQSMQSLGMTMNVTNQIVSLDSHAESFYSKSARRQMNSNRSDCSSIVTLSI